MIRSPLVEFPNKKTIILHYGPETGYQLVFLDSRPDPGCDLTPAVRKKPKKPINKNRYEKKWPIERHLFMIMPNLTLNRIPKMLRILRLG